LLLDLELTFVGTHQFPQQHLSCSLFDPLLIDVRGASFNSSSFS
jgi:hypothetical protein